MLAILVWFPFTITHWANSEGFWLHYIIDTFSWERNTDIRGEMPGMEFRESICFGDKNLDGSYAILAVSTSLGV